MLVLGRVLGAFGVRGAVKVTPLSEAPDTLVGQPVWFLRKDGSEPRAHAAREVRLQGDAVVAMLEGVADREAAMALRGTEVLVPREALAPLAEDEMYVADLVGLAVVNREGAALGEVVAVDEFGAHPVLRVRSGDGRTRLIPYVAALVDGVDRDARTIVVDWGIDY